MKVSVVIPVYKKAEMVMRNLKHNMPHFKGYDVVVVDDASGEGLAKKIKEAFPKIRVIENEENKGFAPTVNIGVEAAEGELVALLGSDVRMTQPFPKDVLNRFEDHDGMFGISFKQKEDGSMVGKNRIYFDRGLPYHDKTDDVKKGFSAWADGGASLIRKKYFHELGGFNELYAPFYWEDNDLSFRAYSRGWYVQFEPSIVVEHTRSATIRQFYTESFVKTIAFRNQLIFIWSNITDKEYWRQHLVWLPYYVVWLTLRGQTEYIRGFFAALIRMSRISKDRERKREHEVVADSEIFERFSKNT